MLKKPYKQSPTSLLRHTQNWLPKKVKKVLQPLYGDNTYTLYDMQEYLASWVENMTKIRRYSAIWALIIQLLVE